MWEWCRFQYQAAHFPLGVLVFVGCEEVEKKLHGLTHAGTTAGGCKEQSPTVCTSWTCWDPAGLRESLTGLPST